MRRNRLDEVETQKAKTAPEISFTFRCNICDSRSEAKAAQLGRDIPSCSHCGSSLRLRGVIHALSTALFGCSLSISEFPDRPDVTGIGLSDWVGYADRLASKLGYRNTFFDREPSIDVTDPPDELQGTLDFLIASDVFEHVAPPVQRAFDGAFRLLKQGGVLVLTTPCVLTGETVEHFPNLHEYEVVDPDGRKVLINRAADGTEEVFEDIHFHSGEGLTLEMRLFARDSLLENFRAAGFEETIEFKEPTFEAGIFWRQPDPIEYNALEFPIVGRRGLLK